MPHETVLRLCPRLEGGMIEPQKLFTSRWAQQGARGASLSASRHQQGEPELQERLPLQAGARAGTGRRGVGSQGGPGGVPCLLPPPWCLLPQ